MFTQMAVNDTFFESGFQVIYSLLKIRGTNLFSDNWNNLNYLCPKLLNIHLAFHALNYIIEKHNKNSPRKLGIYLIII